MRTPSNKPAKTFNQRMHATERLSMRKVEQAKQKLHDDVQARFGPRVPDKSKSPLKF